MINPSETYFKNQQLEILQLMKRVTLISRIIIINQMPSHKLPRLTSTAFVFAGFPRRLFECLHDENWLSDKKWRDSDVEQPFILLTQCQGWHKI